jgi:hypothetical protein
VVNKYEVAKHFAFTIEDKRFDFKLLEEQVTAEAALDATCCRPICPRSR